MTPMCFGLENSDVEHKMAQALLGACAGWLWLGCGTRSCMKVNVELDMHADQACKNVNVELDMPADQACGCWPDLMHVCVYVPADHTFASVQ